MYAVDYLKRGMVVIMEMLQCDSVSAPSMLHSRVQSIERERERERERESTCAFARTLDRCGLFCDQ